MKTDEDKLEVLYNVFACLHWRPLFPHLLSGGTTRLGEQRIGATSGINTGWGMKGLRAVLRRRTWGYRWVKSWTWPSNVCSQPSRPIVPWAASPAVWAAGRGRGFYPSALLWWDPTWSPASSSGVFSTWRTWSCWSRSRRSHKNGQRAGTPLLWRKAEKVVAAQDGEEKAPGTPYCSLKGAYKKDGNKPFSRPCCDRTRGNDFKQKRVDLDWI